MEYRHGPIAIAAPGRATWAFGPVPEGLAEQVAATGCRFEHRDLDPLAELVRVHRLCLAKAPGGRRPGPSAPPDPVGGPRRIMTTTDVREVVAAVDLGGTRTKAALVEPRPCRSSRKVVEPTPQQDLAAAIGAAVASILSRPVASTVGVRVVRCGVVQGWSTRRPGSESCP